MEDLFYCNDSAIRWYVGEMSFRQHGPCEIEEWGLLYFSQLYDGTYNRKAGPSTIYPDGTVYYTNKIGSYHRTDGPAVIYDDGDKEYWVDGKELSLEEFFLKYGVL